MASDIIDKAISVGNFDDHTKSMLKPCSTLTIPLNGRGGYTSNLPIRLAQEFGVSKSVAARLSGAYGGHAAEICRIAMREKHLNDLLVPGHPYIKAEVVFSGIQLFYFIYHVIKYLKELILVRYEWARRAEDIIARRTRLAFLNKVDALKAIPTVVEIMGNELNWTASHRKDEIKRCNEFLDHFGGPVPKT
jgi:glycerol-3-phosphate dehydrogenase